jgi:hypothetical protein
MGYNIWPTGDGVNEQHARRITVMALIYTLGMILWVRFLIWIARSICGC